jgi:hypothetical protein
MNYVQSNQDFVSKDIFSKYLSQPSIKINKPDNLEQILFQDEIYFLFSKSKQKNF